MTRSTIAIADGQATPVTHNFAPAFSTPGTSLWEDRSAGTYIGFNKLTMYMQRPNGNAQSGTRNIKLGAKIETPKLEALGTADSGLTPPPTVAYRPFANIDCTLPERNSLQDRKDLLAYIRGCVESEEFEALLLNYDLAQ
jgi:hypothetical protein